MEKKVTLTPEEVKAIEDTLDVPSPNFKLRSAFERYKQTVRHGRYTPPEVRKEEMSNPISTERFHYVPVDLKMAWEQHGDQYVGWSINFPGVVVQAESFEQLQKEFANGVQVMSQYLYDETHKK